MEENRSQDGRMESQKVGEAWTDYTQKQSEWKGAGQFLTLSDCSSEWKLSVMVQLNICACQEGDKLWQLQWAWIFVVIQKNKKTKTKPNPCSIYPSLQYPWPTSGVPKQRYYTEGEKESSMTEHQVVRRPDFVTAYTAGYRHRNNSQNRWKSLEHKTLVWTSRRNGWMAERIDGGKKHV